MICGGGKTLERCVRREGVENGLMKMLTRKLKLEKNRLFGREMVWNSSSFT